jgi:hypothetical protein
VARALRADIPVIAIPRVETPSTQEGGIKDLRPIGRREQNQPFARIETIELREQLIEGLLSLIVTTNAGKGTVRPPRQQEWPCS